MTQEFNCPSYYVHLLEYYKLKDEQGRRIDYRDHMVHIHLVLVGGAFAWALEQHATFVLLVIPWVCLIIGWSYLLNDDRITAIGDYIRRDLAPALRGDDLPGTKNLFAWEHAHRTDARRVERKLCQFLVDVLEFVLSGIVAVGLFIVMESKPNPFQWIMVGTEIVLMLALGVQFLRYTELTARN